jgi:hypothetical protein
MYIKFKNGQIIGIDTIIFAVFMIGVLIYAVAR